VPDAAASSADEQQQQQQGDAVCVLYLRKAQALAADLAARFGPQDERFRWSDAADLTADSGEGAGAAPGSNRAWHCLRLPA
jgi:hypothetical protein